MLFRVVALGIFAGLLSMPATAVADVFDDNAWEGQFVCGQDNYSFTLIVEESDGSAIRAGIIEFDTAAGAGSYRVRGRIDGRDFLFLSDEWIERPPGMAAVGLDGSLHENGLVMDGVVRGCQNGAEPQFSAERAGDGNGAVADAGLGRVEAINLDGSLTGDWSGEIRCPNPRMEPLPLEMTLVQQGAVVAGEASFPFGAPDAVMARGILHGGVDDGGGVVLGRIGQLPGIRRAAERITGAIAPDTGRFEGVVWAAPSWGGCPFSATRDGPPSIPDLAEMEELGLQGVWAGLRQETQPLFFRQISPSHINAQLRLVLSALDGEPLGTFEIVAPASAPPVRQIRFQVSIVPIARLDTDHVVFVSLSVHRADDNFANWPKGFALMAAVPEDSGEAASLAIQIAHHPAQALQVDRGFMELPRQGPGAIEALLAGEGPAWEFTGSLGGSIAEAVSLDEQCRILIAWAGPYLRGLEADREDLQIIFAPMFADAAFEPVFGLPFSLTTEDERKEIESFAWNVCEPRFGVSGFAGGSFGHIFVSGFDDMIAARMGVEETAAWLEEAQAEVGRLEAEPASLGRLLEIEGEAALRAAEIQPEAGAKLANAISDLRADIAVVAYMGEIEQVPTLPQTEEGLARLVELARKAPTLQLDSSQRDQAHEAINAHLTAIVELRIAEIRASEQAAQNDLDGLASLTNSVRQLAELERRIESPLRDPRVAAARGEVNSRREQLLADETIQTAFALGLDNLQAQGRPRAQVAAWAHAYLMEDEASETAPAPFRAAISRNIARLEVASIDIADRSVGGPAGQPTAPEMALALKRQLDALNESLAARDSSCRAGGFRNDPLAAMECLVVLGAGGGERWETYLTTFEKVGCSGSGGSGYLCDFSAGVASTSPMMQGRLGEILNAGSLNRGRFVMTTEGWQYIKLPVIILR